MIEHAIDFWSDWIIAVSYFAIPIELLYFSNKYKLRATAVRIVLLLFVLFITLCGITHVCNAMLYQSANHIAKTLTAAVSLVTAIALTRVIPLVFALPGQYAELDEEYSYEVNMRIFNQTVVLCTRHLNETQIIKIATETLKYMFPAARLAIVEHGVQLRHGLHECTINDKYDILVDEDLYQSNKRFFDDVSHQIAAHKTDYNV